MYGNKAVRSISELYDDPAKKALSGAGQAWDPAKYVVNEEGFVVPLANLHCGDDKKVLGSKTAANPGGTACPAGERPITYRTCKTTASDGSCSKTTDLVLIGDANPDFNASFSSTFNYKRFAITGLVDWSQGGNIYNGTRQWPFFDNRDRVYDQRGKPEEQKKSQTYYNYFYNGLNAQAYFVEPGTYVKIKEMSVNYTLVRDQLRKVGLGRLENVRLGIVGRNLFTFTKYSGYDPEVSGIAGDPFQFRVDWFQYPHFRTFTGSVEIAF